MWPIREANHCPSTSDEVKNVWSYTAIRPSLHVLSLDYKQGALNYLILKLVAST
jgi:hypothetical protein